MKLYAPEYYKDFKCIANKCRHSCCIGWEIDIDRKTAEKYSKLCGGYGEEIKKSIDFDDVPHFVLSDNDFCPHLNSQKLCKIILEMGEDCLCDICREHPRFYHSANNIKEVGIGLSCEEACRLILSSDGYDRFVEVGDTEDDFSDNKFDTLKLRAEIYSLLSSSSLSLEENLKEIMQRYNVSPDTKTDFEWTELIGSLEYLEDGHKELLSAYSSHFSIDETAEKQLERLFAYFVYRHCTPANDTEDFRTALGFSLFCTKLIASISTAHPEIGINEIARIVSEELEYSEENTDIIKLEFLFI